MVLLWLLLLRERRVLLWLLLLRERRVDVLEGFSVDDIERHEQARRLVGTRGWVINICFLESYKLVFIRRGKHPTLWRFKSPNLGHSSIMYGFLLMLQSVSPFIRFWRTRITTLHLDTQFPYVAPVWLSILFRRWGKTMARSPCGLGDFYWTYRKSPGRQTSFTWKEVFVALISMINNKKGVWKGVKRGQGKATKTWKMITARRGVGAGTGFMSVVLYHDLYSIYLYLYPNWSC